MPWTPEQFNQRHLGGRATPAQARRAAAAANTALESCLRRNGKDCEGYAVRVGRATVKKHLSEADMKLLVTHTIQQSLDEHRVALHDLLDDRTKEHNNDG